MIRKLIVALCVVSLMGLFIASGCQDKSDADISTQKQADPGENIGTTEEHRQEAEKTINEKNAEQELDKIEAEIDADAE